MNGEEEEEEGEIWKDYHDDGLKPASFDTWVAGINRINHVCLMGKKRLLDWNWITINQLSFIHIDLTDNTIVLYAHSICLNDNDINNKWYVCVNGEQLNQ